MKKNPWTKEKSLKLSLSCSSRKEFRTKHRNAYEVSRKNKWIDEICSHMLTPRDIYTLEYCISLCKKYKTINSFIKEHRTCYQIIYRNKWREIVFSHILNIPKSQLSTNEYIEKANIVHNYTYLYDDLIFNNLSSKIKVTCLEHGIFEQIAGSHLKGKGCPKCKNYGTSISEQIIFYYCNKLKLKVESCKKIDGVEVDIYISHFKLAIEYDGYYWHNNKEDREVKKNIFLKKKGINIIRIREAGLDKIKGCFNILRTSKAEQEFSIVINKLIRYINKKYNRNYKIDVDLKKDKVFILNNLTNKKRRKSFINTHNEVAKQWHPIKNGNLTPVNFTHGSNFSAWWLCEHGHEWEAEIYSRTRGSNCPYCSGHKVNYDNNLSITHPKISKEWHPTKNGDLNPVQFSFGSGIKVWWLCDKGHEYDYTIANRTIGRKCPYCYGNKANSDNSLESKYGKEILKKFGVYENNNIKPSEILLGSDKKLECYNLEGVKRITTIRKLIVSMDLYLKNKGKKYGIDKLWEKN